MNSDKIYLRTRNVMMMHMAINPRGEIDRLFAPKKKKDKDPSALKIAWMHQYEDSRTTIKKNLIKASSNETCTITTNRTRKTRKQK